MSVSLLVPEVATGLVNALIENTIAGNAIALVRKGMEIVEKFTQLDGQQKKDLVIAAIRKFANGEDGVAGTADDRIPACVVAGVVALLEHNLVEDLIDVVVAATRGGLDINAVVKKCGMFSCFAQQKPLNSAAP